ncbi:MAG: hypothetical protein AAFX02_10765 [Pseudomonadota bacterium]
MRAILAVLAFGLAACGGTNSLSQDELDALAESYEDPRAASLALVCSGCHGEGNERLVSLSGLSSNYIEAKLVSYRDPEAGDTAMHRVARAYSEDDIERISKFLYAESVLNEE